MTVVSIFTFVYCAWVVSEVLILLITRTRRSSGSVQDRGSLVLLWPAIALSTWAALYYGALHPHTMLHGAAWIQSLALAVFLLGLAVRWVAIFSLGRSFSANVAIHAGQTLYRKGLFRVVRHPSYSGMLLCFVAIGIVERNWVSLAIMLILPTAALLYRIHVEEIALRNAFGQDYVAYSRTTKRLIPGIY